VQMLIVPPSECISSTSLQYCLMCLDIFPLA
jgi:hypothetical protein